MLHVPSSNMTMTETLKGARMKMGVRNGTLAGISSRKANEEAESQELGVENGSRMTWSLCIKVSLPWHYSHLGSAHSLLADHPVYCRTFSSAPGLHPLNASSTSLRHNYCECLQVLPSVPGRQRSPQAKKLLQIVLQKTLARSKTCHLYIIFSLHT